MAATAGSPEAAKLPAVPNTEAGSGVGDLKQRVTLEPILGHRNCDVGRLDDQITISVPGRQSPRCKLHKGGSALARIQSCLVLWPDLHRA
jgi:hypothetical protein